MWLLEEARSLVRLGMRQAFVQARDPSLEVRYDRLPKVVVNGLFATRAYDKAGLTLVPFSPLVGSGDKVPSGTVPIDTRKLFPGELRDHPKMWITGKFDLPSSPDGPSSAKPKDPFVVPFWACRTADDSSQSNLKWVGICVWVTFPVSDGVSHHFKLADPSANDRGVLVTIPVLTNSKAIKAGDELLKSPVALQPTLPAKRGADGDHAASPPAKKAEALPNPVEPKAKAKGGRGRGRGRRGQK